MLKWRINFINQIRIMMAKSLVTMGSSTSHGGILSECENTFIINGIAVHLHGMKHYCPKCQAVVSAIAVDQSTVVQGRGVVLAGDKTTCGATFLGNQTLVFSKK
jgi:uncharacterized Zn-binding protein involved in type VI secretion